jgi:hypothetical protein
MIPFRRSKTNTDASKPKVFLTGSTTVNPFRRNKTTTTASLKRSDTSATTSSTTSAPEITELDPCEYGDMGMDEPRASREPDIPQRLPDRRRGGVLFKESSRYDLHAVRYLEPKKSILKVATVEDSLRACQLHQEKEAKLSRPSLNLDMLSTSLRALLLHQTDLPPRGCHSCGHGMDLHDGASDETSVTYEPDSGSETSVVREPKVRFAAIHSRLYPVAADDNPSASGKGAAIALSGWFFHTEPDVSIDAYEAIRPPPRPMKDLKIDVVERRRRLLAAGVSHAEIMEFAKRHDRAKIQRMETMQSFSINGPGYMAKLERRERLGRFVSRAFGIRKTNSRNQAALWDLAQNELPAVKKATRRGSA